MQYLPLTRAQQRIWLEWKIAPDNPAYNNPLLYRLDGELNLQALTHALQCIINKQPALRCNIVEQGGLPLQVLSKKCNFQLDYHDITALTETEKNQKIAAVINHNVRRGFQLATEPLFRFSLIRIMTNEYIFILNIHHIVVDGFSASLLLADISRYYQRSLENEEVYDPALDQQYIDHLTAAIPTITNEQKQFWWQQLENTQYAVDLVSANKVDNLAYAGERYAFSISEELTQQVKQTAKQLRTTDFNILLACFYITLAKFANQYDMTIGYPVDIRAADCKGLYGFFVNTIPLRCKQDKSNSFAEVIAYINQRRKQIKPQQRLDLIDIVLALRNYAANIPGSLFNVSFIRANFALSGLALTDIAVIAEEIYTGAVKDDLCLLFDFNGTYQFNIEYRLNKYSKELALELEQAYITCVNQVCANSQLTLRQIKLANSQLLAMPVAYPLLDNLISRFLQHVKGNPNQIAIVSQTRQITYAQLYQAVFKFRHALSHLPNDKPIILCIHRNDDLIAIILALQWLGITFIPVDTQIPVARLLDIYHDAQASVIMLDQERADLAQVNTLRSDQLDNTDKSNPKPYQGSKNPAYIIYTSGSTGKPKGVVISVNALNHFLMAMHETLATTASDYYLASTTIAFDIAYLELLLPIWVGARVYIANNQEHKDPFAIQAILEKHAITMMQATPAFWTMLLDARWNGARKMNALSGGENLTSALASQLLAKVKTLWNVYGPTEATIWCATKKITDPTQITIGHALPTMMIAVLDDDLIPLPVYAKGHLYLYGASLADGYLNQPTLTAKQFITHPNGTMLYQTGDIAAKVANHEFMVFGRADQQIKLNGYRIELGEIESKLAQIKEITHCAVLVLQQQLVGYLTVNATITEHQIISHLHRYLPDYMIPKRYLFLDNMPMTVSGKIARNRLPEIAIAAITDITLATTEIEKYIAACWQSQLAPPIISVTTHFYQYGGHSLLAASIIATINQHYRLQLTLLDFFNHSTVRDLAKLVEQKLTEQKQTQITTQFSLNSTAFYPLSETQKRIWFLQQLHVDNGQYNMAAYMSVTGELQLVRLQQAFKLLTQKHPILRCQLTLQAHEPYQYLVNDTRLPWQEITSQLVPEHNIATQITDWAKLPFAFYECLLWKVQVLLGESGKTYIALCCHHIIADGSSVPILLRDVWQLYQTLQGTAENPAFIAYAQASSSANYQDMLRFWQIELANAPYLQLPNDFPRLSKLDPAGKQYQFVIDNDIWLDAKHFCAKHKITQPTLLLGAFAILLQQLCQLNDVCFGMPYHNRRTQEEADSIGCFMNLIPVRIRLMNVIDIQQWLISLGQHLQHLLLHGEVPFTAIVDALQLPRSLAKPPLFNLVFNAQPEFATTQTIENLSITTNAIHTATSKYDATFDFYFTDTTVRLSLEYATALFTEETVIDWCDHYTNILKTLITQSTLLLHEVSQIPAIRVNRGVQSRQKTVPTDKEQCFIANIWRQMLAIDEIFLEDNYFSLGGDSLRATKLVATLGDLLQKRIPLELIFTCQTFFEFCEQVAKLPIIKQACNQLLPHDLIPLTANQVQLALLAAQSAVDDSYHLGVLIEWPTTIDLTKLQIAVDAVINQHCSYRLQLRSRHEAIIQAKVACPIAIFSNIAKDRVVLTAREFANRAYNFEQAPLIRIAVLVDANNQAYLAIAAHHIIADEWSLQLLADAIYQMYFGSMTNKLVQLPEPSTQTDQTADLFYWQSVLQDQYPSAIPYTHSKASIEKRAGICSHILAKAAVAKLQTFAQTQHASLANVCLATLSFVLAAFTNQPTLLISYAYDRRNTLAWQHWHGYRINLLPILLQLGENSVLTDVIQQTQQIVAKATSHSEIDFNTLLQQQITYKPSIVFSFQHAHIMKTNHGVLKWHELTPLTAKFPITINLRLTANHELRIECEYDRGLYSSSLIESLLLTYTKDLQHYTAMPDQPYQSWQTIQRWRNPMYQLPAHTLLAKLQQVVANNGQQIAVIYNNQEMSYSQLWLQARKVATQLQARYGNVQGKIIAVNLANSNHYIITILGILAAGAIFLPIALTTPRTRKQTILIDSDAILLVSEESADNMACPITSVQALQASSNGLAPLIDNPNAGYLIYTSGSTGQPKGVYIKIHSLCYFIDALSKTLDLLHSDHTLQFSSISFDASIWEIFTALYTGGKLVIPNEDERRVSKPLQAFMQTHKISHAILTPTVLSMLDPSVLPDLRKVISGGEACTEQLVTTWGDKVDFFNAYGPTEATVCVLLQKMTSEISAQTIGQPLGCSELTVLSPTMQPAPIGAIGELYIAGEILAANYLNLPTETAEKFRIIRGKRWYATGDYVRYLAKGFEYRGRRDNQIKLRGLRIELNEITSLLHQHAEIKQAYCMLQDHLLIAYVISNSTLTESQIRSYLAQSLPTYMLPNAIMQLSSMPMTASGKIAERELPQPTMATSFTLASSPVEIELQQIWCQHLAITINDVDTDFFVLGGNSLQAMQISADIEDKWGIDFSLAAFYEHMTIREQANYLKTVKDKLNMPHAMAN